MGVSLALDHLTILSRDPALAQRFYGVVLPLLGFQQKNAKVWSNQNGLFVQFGEARPDTADYGRYAPGLNHFGFAAPDRETVLEVHKALLAEDIECRLQELGMGTLALFIPDPDGLRVELAYYPPGVDPVS